MAMKKDAFLNPKAILTSMCGMLLGVVIYCGVIAPLFKDGTYAETAGRHFETPVLEWVLAFSWSVQCG